MLSYKSGFESAVNFNKIKSIKDFTFADNTTYGLGGTATEAYVPNNVIQAKYVYDRLKRQNLKIEILGNGSNVLASDKGLDGGVIVTKKLEGIIRISKTKLLCLCGTKISKLLTYCKRNLLSGLEFMYGIPATVGGAAYMNAGVGSESIGDRISSVKLYDGNIVNLSNKMCNFAYRQSTMRNINGLILSIIVNLDESSTEAIDDKISRYRSRRSHLPEGKSCGCVFKNPVGLSAGLLIDSAGLKGLRVGNAFVSEKHADFIINCGKSASDVKELIELVKLKVFQKFGILLREEVVYIGEFNDFDG